MENPPTRGGFPFDRPRSPACQVTAFPTLASPQGSRTPSRWVVPSGIPLTPAEAGRRLRNRTRQTRGLWYLELTHRPILGRLETEHQGEVLAVVQRGPR